MAAYESMTTEWTPLFVDFPDSGGILSCWMMNATLMQAEHGLEGCWMMNGRDIARRSHTLELEELGGFVDQTRSFAKSVSFVLVSQYY